MNKTAFLLGAIEMASKGEDLRSIELLCYKARDRRFLSASSFEVCDGEFGEAPPEEQLGDTMHIALINVNGRRYRAITNSNGQIECSKDTE